MAKNADHSAPRSSLQTAGHPRRQQHGENSYKDLQLYDAARRGQDGRVRSLLDAGAKPDGFLGKYGGTALLWAIRENHRDIAALLVEYGANVSHRDRYGISAYHFAYLKGHRQLAELLVCKGADGIKPSLRQRLIMHLSEPFAHASAKRWLKTQEADMKQATPSTGSKGHEISKTAKTREKKEKQDGDGKVKITSNKGLVIKIEKLNVDDIYTNEGYTTLLRIRHFDDVAVGDHVAIPRKVIAKMPTYWHHAIVEQKDPVKKEYGVIHYQKRRGKIAVLRETLELKVLFKVKHNPGYCLPSAEVVRRAQLQLGLQNYNLICNNCEHFACECKTGQRISGQVTKFGQVLICACFQRLTTTSTILGKHIIATIVKGGAIHAVRSMAPCCVVSAIFSIAIEVGFIVDEWDKALQRYEKQEIDRETYRDIMTGRVCQGLFDVGLALGGMLVGAAFGAGLPPLGPIIGSIIGGLVGGFLGKGIGYFLGKLIAKLRRKLAAIFIR